MLKKFNDLDTNKAINNAFDKTTDAYEEENRVRMMDGVKNDGGIMPNYSYVSQVVYGYPDEPIKLKDTGAFQKALTAKREGDTINIVSTDGKADMLAERYGEEIYGVFGSAYHRGEYLNEHYRPAFYNDIEQQTGLKFSKK